MRVLRILLAAGLSVLCTFAVMSCQNQYVIGPGGSGGTGGGNGAVNPTDPVGCSAITAVKVVVLGSSPCTLGSGNVITAECVASVTATPMIGNIPADPTVHGPNVTWSATGSVEILSRGDNEFNKGVRGIAPGGYTVTATNCGKSGTLSGSVR